MKIAIHNRPGSFSDQWIGYCERKNLDYKVVDAYNTNVISQLSDCDVFLWHHSHIDYRDVLFAKQLLFSLEISGKKVYPNINTGWCFDDKVGEKYYLESIGAPIVPSYVFYDEFTAIKWIEETSFPKVIKLRGGAGASNVKLVNNKKEAEKMVHKAFHTGFSQFDRMGYVKDRYDKFKRGKESFGAFCKSLGRLVIPPLYSKMHGREKGYVLFQDFVDNYFYNIRVLVHKNKVYVEKRFDGDQSVDIKEKESVVKAVKSMFCIIKELGIESIGFDFVYVDGAPQIIGIVDKIDSFNTSKCSGYWLEDLSYHEVVDGSVLSFNNSKETIEKASFYLTDYKGFDLRVVVIGDKILAERRYCRKGDFRASGSGSFEYVNVDKDILSIAFETAERLSLQTVAFDFIFKDNKPLIIEMSYGFGIKGLSKCPGYWTRDFEWHESNNIDICGWILETVLSKNK